MKRIKSKARSILEPFKPSIEQIFIDIKARYEYHFSDDVIKHHVRYIDIVDTIQFSDQLKLRWQYCAELIIDHHENKIIKNRFGRLDR